jgi:hypothetical protein
VPIVSYDLLPLVLVVLLAGTILATALLRVRPQSRAQWIALWVTVTFLVWLLGGFVHLRSR